MSKGVLQNAYEQLIADLTPVYGSGEARSIARIVFEDAFGAQRPAEKKFTPGEKRLFQQIYQRLLAGEPVQYILGQADFYGLKFLVSPAVLIPRQETEELVAWVSERLKAIPETSPAVLDIGLGSGCIAVTLKAKHPGIRMYGLEKSPEALDIALENARRLLGETDIFFFPGDVLDSDCWKEIPPLDIVVSNPPYIPQQERVLLPKQVLDYEPGMALFVENDDPLLFYRTIAGLAREKLGSGGVLFFECNEFNAPAVVELLEREGFISVELRQDLAGADRMVKAVQP